MSIPTVIEPFDIEDPNAYLRPLLFLEDGTYGVIEEARRLGAGDV